MYRALGWLCTASFSTAVLAAEASHQAAVKEMHGSLSRYHQYRVIEALLIDVERLLSHVQLLPEAKISTSPTAA
jgi:hypothetical protein